jgi:hypothetical protein
MIETRRSCLLFNSLLQVAFLNLMSNIVERAGSVQVRVGGNSQEAAVLVMNTTDGRILEKDLTGISNPVRPRPWVDLVHGLTRRRRHKLPRWCSRPTCST